MLRRKVLKKSTSAYPLTPKTKAKKMMTAAGIKPVGVPEIKKQLLFAEAISLTSGKKKKE